jgi:D-glycero-D-manno-heptose 1,7-bisphosphate phosphatase
LLVTDGESRVVGWLTKEDPRRWYKNLVNAGVHVLNRGLLAQCPHSPGASIDLDRELLKPALATGRIFAYHTPEYIKDMGTPERYRQVEADMAAGLVAARNLARKQRAVFIDRDGTINRLAGFITTPEQLELLPGVGEAIGAINRAGYLAIVVTNQPVIARGEAELEDLAMIHNKMETELGKAGAYLDDLFFCPHHPDKGFPGERPEYKMDCDCRKPKPGMLLAAAQKYNIDLAASYMVGDEPKDGEAGRAAGCGGIFTSLQECVRAIDSLPKAPQSDTVDTQEKV